MPEIIEVRQVDWYDEAKSHWNGCRRCTRCEETADLMDGEAARLFYAVGGAVVCERCLEGVLREQVTNG